MHFVVMGSQHTAEMLVLCRRALRDLGQDRNAEAPPRDPRTHGWLEILAALPITGRVALVEAGG